MQSNFEKWLELATPLAEKTIKNYVWAISTINSYLAEKNIVQSSLDEIDSAVELEEIKKDYLARSKKYQRVQFQVLLELFLI